jgi:ATPase subunit of ABC transporter with duplicated ATPase domains
LLLREPDLLVLDEPTNHLDAAARAVLHQLFAEWPRGLLVISHDRAVLAGVDRILELSTLGARLYGGGYEAYRAQRDVELAAAERDLDEARTALKRSERDVQATRERKERQDARGRKSRSDGSQPRLVLNARRERSQSTGARLAAEGARELDGQRERLHAARARVEARARLAFALPPTGLHATKRVVEVRDAAFAFPGQSDPRIRAFNLTLTGAERVAIVGENGAGKSTLLRLLAGELAPTSGEVVRGVPADRLAVLDQKISWPIPRGSLLENFQAYNPDADASHARQALATFLFRGDSALQPVATLSGGEALRGAMAAQLHAPTPPLLLLLDEPTNHLDLDSLEAVEGALRAYDGALVVVSHDAAFLQAIGITRQVERDASGVWR